MTDTSRLRIAPGAGRVARRERALLFLPEGSSAELVERFRRSEHDALAEELTGHVLDHQDAVAAFVFIGWSAAAEGTHIHVVVRGDAEVFSDLDGLPSLSGAGSATWVEHRVVGDSDAARFRSGAPAEADTDLRDGVVGGAGFELQLIVRPTADPSVLPQRVDRVTSGQLVDHDTPDRERRLDRIANLEAAGGGDWMEESLQLGDSAAPRNDQPSSAPTVAHSVELPDGTLHRVTGIVVLGRRPDATAARAPGAAVVSLDASASVSRTHLLLSLEGQKLFATDCSSSGGTLLSRTGGPEPVRLEPWTAHEVGNGDRLHLGGAETSLVIHGS